MQGIYWKEDPNSTNHALLMLSILNPIDPNPAIAACMVFPQCCHSRPEKCPFFHIFPHFSKKEASKKYLLHMGVQYFKLKLMKCSLVYKKNLWILALNLGENLREFGEILGKYHIFDGISVGHEGLISLCYCVCPFPSHKLIVCYSCIAGYEPSISTPGNSFTTTCRDDGTWCNCASFSCKSKKTLQ